MSDRLETIRALARDLARSELDAAGIAGDLAPAWNREHVSVLAAHLECSADSLTREDLEAAAGAYAAELGL